MSLNYSLLAIYFVREMIHGAAKTLTDCLTLNVPVPYTLSANIDLIMLPHLPVVNLSQDD